MNATHIVCSAFGFIYILPPKEQTLYVIVQNNKNVKTVNLHLELCSWNSQSMLLYPSRNNIFIHALLDGVSVCVSYFILATQFMIIVRDFSKIVKYFHFYINPC